MYLKSALPGGAGGDPSSLEATAVAAGSVSGIPSILSSTKEKPQQ